MKGSTILYLVITAVFTAAFTVAAVAPRDNTTGYLCAAGTVLFIWRIIRGDD